MSLKNRGVTILYFSMAAVLLISASPKSSGEPNFEKAAEEGNQETKEFFLTETEAGQTKWDIRSSSAEFSSEGIVYLKKVKINLYEDGNRILNIKADGGRFDDVNKNVHLKGNVIGITDRGESFLTQSLHWISAEERIESADKIKITGENMIINAQGLVLYPALNKIILKKNVKAEIYGGNEAFSFKFGE